MQVSARNIGSHHDCAAGMVEFLWAQPGSVCACMCPAQGGYGSGCSREGVGGV